MLSDTLITALFNTAIGAVVTISLAVIQKRAARKVASKVEAVAADLKEGDVATAHELSAIRTTGDKTHALVNSDRTQLLKISAMMARRIATLEPHGDNEALARAAEEAYRAALDAQPPPERTAGNVFTTQNQHGRQKE